MLRIFYSVGFGGDNGKWIESNGSVDGDGVSSALSLVVQLGN